MVFSPIENMENLQVNHIDGDKANNKLEWYSASENQQHAFDMGLSKPRKGEKSNFSKLTDQDISLIFALRKKGLTQKAISEIIGCFRANIPYILNQKTWQVGSSTTIRKE